MKKISNNKIILIRHAKPNYSVKNWVNANEAMQHLSNFNKADVVINEKDQKKITHLQSLIEPKMTVYSSTLTRSIKTASIVLNSNKYQQNNIFNEFDLAILRISLLKLPFNLWVFLSRIGWFLGANLPVESYLSAKKRAEKAAQFLIEESQKQDVVLFGHGFLNNAIGKYFKKNGWVVFENNIGNHYLNYKVYIKDSE